MSNTSNFIEFQHQRSLIMESYFELVEQLPSPGGSGKLLWVIALISTGWLLSLGTILLTCQIQHPLRKRKPSRAVFYAAYQEKIRQTFQHQRNGTFNTILMGVNRVLARSPEEPTVFLFLAPRGCMPTARRLVTVLIHCILVAYHYPASMRYVTYLTSDGSNYTSHNDEWPFYHLLHKQLRFYGVAAVFSCEQLHPQVIRAVSLLAPLVFAPYPKSVLILVVDLQNRFTEHQKEILTPNQLGKIFLQEQLIPYFDQNEVSDMVNQIGSRSILINPEPNNSQHFIDI